jgi:hypothetical protein
MIILKLILKELGVRVWTGFIWLRTGSSEHGNEPSDSVKSNEFD